MRREVQHRQHGAAPYPALLAASRAMQPLRRCQSCHRGDRQGVPDDLRRRPARRDRARRPGDARLERATLVAGPREAGRPRRRAARRARASGSPTSSCARWASRSSRRWPSSTSAPPSTSTTPTTRPSSLADEPIELLDGDGSRDPPQPLRRPARDHAVELPLLPGGALRGPEPRDRQHDPAQARAPVPGVGRGDPGALPRGRLPGGRVQQHLRVERADRVRSSATRACAASR